MNIVLIVQIVVVAVVFFFGMVVLRQLLFYGFAPFLPSHPEAMEKILEQAKIKDGYKIYSLGHGRSGFLHAVEKAYPQTILVGVEDSGFHCIVARLQILLRRSRIKIIKSDYYKADIHDARIVYCYLDVSILREMYKKLRVEPRAGAIIISSGFVIPYFEPLKVLKVESKKRWFNIFIGGGEKVVSEKEKEFKADNNIYYYEV